MKGNFKSLLSFTMAITLLITGCSNFLSSNKSQMDKSTTQIVNKELSGEINVWTWAKDVLLPIVPEFNQLFPNVKVNIQEIPNIFVDPLHTIEAGAGGPDVMAIEQGELASVNNIAGIEDLYQAPYNAHEFDPDIIPAQLDRFKSLDGKRLIAMPLDAPPAVMFYRTDILEAAGFPIEPEKLAAYLKSEDNLLKLAIALKAEGKLFLPPSGLFVSDFLTGNSGYFDHNLNYLKNTEQYVKELDFDKKIHKLGLVQAKGPLVLDGKQAVDDGEIPIIFSGSWMMLPYIFPAVFFNQAGKWKVTALPLGNYAGFGGAGLAILTQSKNKLASWEFVKFATVSMAGWKTTISLPSIPGYKPAWRLPEIQNTVDPFLNQKAIQLYIDLVAKIPYLPLSTSLDKKANEIFRREWQEAIELDKDSKLALNQIEEDVMKAVKPERDALLSEFNRNEK